MISAHCSIIAGRPACRSRKRKISLRGACRRLCVHDRWFAPGHVRIDDCSNSGQPARSGHQCSVAGRSRDCARRTPRRQQFAELRKGQGRGDEIALALLDAARDQRADLLLGFDAFRNTAASEVAAQMRFHADGNEMASAGTHFQLSGLVSHNRPATNRRLTANQIDITIRKEFAMMGSASRIPLGNNAEAAREFRSSRVGQAIGAAQILVIRGSGPSGQAR